MRGDDTHCSRCGAALTPVPVFTRVEWECPCVPVAKTAPGNSGWYSLPTCASMVLPITIRMVFSVKFPSYVGSVLKVIYFDPTMDCFVCECVMTADGSVPSNGYTQLRWPANAIEEQFEVVSF